MRPSQFLSMISFILLVCAFANADVLMSESPLDLDDFFDEGNRVDTQFIDGILTLNPGADIGTWDSPIFYVDSKAIWNRIEAEANWDEFGLNLIKHGDAEDVASPDFWYFSSGDNFKPPRSAYAHSGSHAFLLQPTLGYAFNSFQGRTGFSRDVLCVDNPPNIFPIADYPVHLVLWAQGNFKHGDATALLQYAYFDPELDQYCSIPSWKVWDSVRLPVMSEDFTRFQFEFDMDMMEKPQNAEYAYLLIAFADTHSDGEQNTIYLDDILMFNDSRIKLQARTADDAGCTEWSEYGDTRLIYANLVKTPAPVSRCIQFKVTLVRDPFTQIAPELSRLNMTFAKAFDFTRPDYDKSPAAFTIPSVDSRSRGIVRIGDSGEMYFEASGEPAKFYGIQAEIDGLIGTVDVDGDGDVDGADYGHELCGYMEKYGMNMLKLAIQGGEDFWDMIDEEQALRENLTNFYSKFFPACESHGVYFFLRLTPHLYVDEDIGIQHAGGHVGPVWFADQEVVDSYKEYIDLILNHDMGGWTIGDDPAFVFVETMNEETLLFGWLKNTTDGLNPNSYVLPREIKPVWANKLRGHFNEWLRRRYPTYDLLDAAWRVQGQSGPYLLDDGTCNAGTYEDRSVCNLTIIPYDITGQARFSQRKKDTIDFLAQREEDVYLQLQDEVQNQIGSHILHTGGKPLWDNPAAALSSEKLDVIDMHLYGGRIDWYGDDDAWSMLLSNDPFLSNMQNLFVTRSMQMRFSDKPFFVGEFEYPTHSENAAEYMLHSVFGSVLGWDGIVQFIFSKDFPDGRMAFFSIPYEATATALLPAAVRIFKDRQIGSNQQKVSIDLKREVGLSYPFTTWEQQGPFYAEYANPAYLLVKNVEWRTMNSSSTSMEVLPTLNPPYTSGTGEVVVDPRKRKVVVNSPFVEGVIGDYDQDAENIDTFSFVVREAEGIPTYALFLTSLDDLPLDSSQKMLLTAAGPAENSRMRWSTYHFRAWKCTTCQPFPSPFGLPPVWMSNVEADITIQSDSALRVTPLDKLGGMREEESFIASPSAGDVSFAIGSAFNTPWYLIERESCLWQQYDSDCDGIVRQQGLILAVMDFFQGVLMLDDFVTLLEMYSP